MEIEIKYRVLNQTLAEIENAVKDAGGVFLEESVERDSYFNVFGRDSLRTKECLRIRESKVGHEITYKPASTTGNQGRHFAKKETNLSIHDPIAAQELLLCLGSNLLVVVEKKRRYYSLLDCTVCIDDVTSLGFFLEIEFVGEDVDQALTKIKRCAKLLSLDDRDVVVEPYRDLVIASTQSH